MCEGDPDWKVLFTGRPVYGVLGGLQNDLHLGVSACLVDVAPDGGAAGAQDLTQPVEGQQHQLKHATFFSLPVTILCFCQTLLV